MTTVELCSNEVLKRGLDDWIQVAEVVSVVLSIAGRHSAARVKELTLEVIERLIRADLMKPGEVTSNGFREWEATADQALERITISWHGISRLPELGEICWLCNTERGDIMARALQ